MEVSVCLGVALICLACVSTRHFFQKYNRIINSVKSENVTRGPCASLFVARRAPLSIPGLGFAVPFVERFFYKRSHNESAIPIKPQAAITKDNVHVRLGGAVYTRVEGAYKASYGIDDPTSMIPVLAQSAIRK